MRFTLFLNTLLIAPSALAFVPRDPRKGVVHPRSICFSAPPMEETETTTTSWAKSELVKHLLGGTQDDSPELEPFMDILRESYEESKIDARTSRDPCYNGDWKNVNTPAFAGRIGFTKDDRKLPIYSIKGLTFGLIPSSVEVAVEKMVQHVFFAEEALSKDESIPKALVGTVEAQPEELRTNHIDTVFAIPDTSVRGVLRMEGYTIPSLEESNKYDTWFVGGRCIPDEGVQEDEWRKVFGNDVEQLEYTLPNVISAYQTVIYMDDDLRVSIGNRGAVMIVGRDRVYRSIQE